jgi:chemotaxis protein CheZ
MPAMDVALQVREALARLNKTDLKDPRLMEVLDLSQQLVDAMQAFFGALDKSAHSEFRYIATYIARTRQEISVLRPNDIREERIPAAGAELEAIVKHTEAATHTIMEAAEAIMMADPTDPVAFKAVVDDRVMEIFQACSFQDITGQRVQKVVDTLKHIESRVARFAQVMGVEDACLEEADPREARKKALLLNGPALDGPEVKQDEIDAMFSTKAEPASQDEIDRLFA